MKILFMGRKSVAADTLRYLCNRGDMEVVGVLTDDHLAVSPTSDVAREFSIRIYSFEEALNAMESGALKFDLGISVLYWRKLKDGFLSIPKYGAINFHPAPLPQYKGTAGYNLAILNSLDQWGVTAHYMDTQIDTGKIIEVAHFSINPASVTVSVLERMSAKVLYDLFVKTINRIFEARNILPTTSNEGGIYVSRNQMEEMKRIMPGDNIDRKIRAFWYPPYDGAFIEIEGKKFTLVNREILNSLGDPSISNLFTLSSSEKK